MKTRSNAEWLSALKAGAADQAEAIGDLRALAVRAALHTLRRGRPRLGLMTPAEIDHLAEDCAQDALLAILQNLDRFRGESRFTTWAYSFAVNTALVAARRETWKRVPLDEVIDKPDPWSARPDPATADPDRQATQDETIAVLRAAIDSELTDRQRQALKAIVFEGVPLDELARHWGSNRNALYKLLHDARRKLKAHLEKTLGLFGAER